jgi:hypothetical protein
MVNKHAQVLGRKGGKKKSDKKTLSCRKNGIIGAKKRWCKHEWFEGQTPAIETCIKCGLNRDAQAVESSAHTSQEGEVDL